MATCEQMLPVEDCNQSVCSKQNVCSIQTEDTTIKDSEKVKDEVDSKHRVLLGTGSTMIPYVPIDIRSLFTVKKAKDQPQDTNSSNIHKTLKIYPAGKHQSSCSNPKCSKKANKSGTHLANRNDNRSCCCKKEQKESQNKPACIDKFDNFDDPCSHIPEELQKDCAEVCRVVFDNIWITKVNTDLKLKLKQLRGQQMSETSRILNSVLTYCEARAEMKKETQTQLPPPFSHRRLSAKVRRPTTPGGVAGRNFRPCTRILGEIAFQLERRILGYVLGTEAPHQSQVYGYTVVSVCRALEDNCAGQCVDSDYEKGVRATMKTRLQKMLCALEPYGYSRQIHPDFTIATVNKYGLLPAPPSPETALQFGLNDACALTRLVTRLTPAPAEQRNLQILLNCLNFLSSCDTRPLLIW